MHEKENIICILTNHMTTGIILSQEPSPSLKVFGNRCYEPSTLLACLKRINTSEED